MCIRDRSGGDIDAFLPELARLRIRVFREYPYLYEGSAAYEEKYLKTYANVPESVMVLVWDCLLYTSGHWGSGLLCCGLDTAKRNNYNGIRLGLKPDIPARATGGALLAVSYTHLDVYKRQISERLTASCQIDSVGQFYLIDHLDGLDALSGINPLR